MSYSMEGQIEIPLEEFWEFAKQYLPNNTSLYSYGLPRIDIPNQEMVINFAASSDVGPEDWIKTPSCIEEWKQKGK